jgi:hypothetical protein
MGDERSRAAVETAAQYADGLVTEDYLVAAAAAAQDAYLNARREKGEVAAYAELAAARAAFWSVELASYSACNFAFLAAGDGVKPGPEHTAQCHLLRCIFGPLPFRAVTIDMSWLTWNGGLVPRLAHSIYDERAFDHLPILADALLEAGCDDADILGHCRQPGPHVRGCWLVDLLTERS